MVRTMAEQVPDEQYRDCFVAFLDILGFRDLVERSAGDPQLLGLLAGMTASGARLNPGTKETSLGPCLMQTRAFSDCIVVFTPTQPMDGEPAHPNPLAQLLFVVRYFHDRVLELGACIRGGVTIGLMYWHKAWNNSARLPARTALDGLHLTFGQGLVDAYKLESETAKVPRVVMSESVIEHAREKQLSADPFAACGRSDLLTDYIRPDRDAVTFLDLLHPQVTRSRREKVVTGNNGFTVQWKEYESSHDQVVDNCTRLVKAQLVAQAKESIRNKYEWLQRYVATRGVDR